ncbi:hypothetical protein ACH4U7_51845, partial [Streptomyces sp. NPDC020845]
MIVTLLYKLTRKLLTVPSVLLHRETAKDAELLVLRHENAVLRLSDSVGRCDGSPEMTFGCGGHCSLLGLFPGGEGEIMSMRPLPAPAVPESTAGVARA